jgi:acyl-CoA thioesterase-1
MKAGTWILVAFMVCGLTGAASAKLVACVGDSITYGAGITDRVNFGYPAQLQRLLRQYDRSWEVRNFGVSGTTLLSRGDLPYIRQTAYDDAQACHPDLVIINLGTNDFKPQNWQYQADFVADYSTMIDVFRALPSQPQVWICKPVPAYLVGYGITPAVIRDEILPLIEQLGREKDVPVIDLYTALLDGLDDALLTEFDLNPQDSPLSVFAWVKGGAPGQVILSQKSGINWLMADPVTGALITEFRGGSRHGGALSSQTVIADDQWHHVGFVWDGAARTLYVDDVPVAQDAQSALIGGFGALRIGCGKSMAAGSFWSGLIDDVRIYCRGVQP